MARTLTLVSLIVGGVFVGSLTGALRGQVTPSAPPPTPARPVTETLHGVAVTDPYRWMEDGGEEFINWMKAQDAYTRTLLQRIPGGENLAAALRAVSTLGVGVARPRRAGNRYFYVTRRKLYVREATSGTERVLVDPATLGDGAQPSASSDYSVSPMAGMSRTSWPAAAPARAPCASPRSRPDARCPTRSIASSTSTPGGRTAAP